MTKQDAVSGPQREPDERVRDALKWADRVHALFGGAPGTLAAALRRLQAAQREPQARPEDHPPNDGSKWGNPKFGCVQRDDHPTEGLPGAPFNRLELAKRINRALQHALNCLSIDAKLNTPDYVLADRLTPLMLDVLDGSWDAALAASKGTPDSMGHPRSRETAAESLSVDTSVADPACASCGHRLQKDRDGPARFCPNPDCHYFTRTQ